MLNNTTLKELSVLNPTRFTIDMILNWVIVILCMVLWNYTQSWFLYIPLAFIVATRQQAMGILVHDIAHQRYLKNSRLADLIGNVFMGYPLLLTVEAYRSHHLKHHRYLNTEKDPDWNYKIGKKQYDTPTTRARLFTHLLKTTLGMGVIEMAMYMTVVYKKPAQEKEEDSSSSGVLFKIAYAAIVITSLIYFDVWKLYLLLWLVPQFTFLMGLLELRSFTEHVGLTLDDNPNKHPARSIKANALERFLFNPHFAHYHLEHHLYPSVPYYNLTKLHETLTKSEEFMKDTTIAEGYFSQRGTITQIVSAGADSRLMR